MSAQSPLSMMRPRRPPVRPRRSVPPRRRLWRFLLLAAVIVALPAVRRVMTPGFLKSYRVRQAARRHFVAVAWRQGTFVCELYKLENLCDRSTGCTPMNKTRSLGMGNLPIDQLVNLRIHGIVE